MAEDPMGWQGNNIFRTSQGGYNFVPSGSTAARLLSGVMGPDPNQSAPAGFGGLVAQPDGTFGTYGSGSQLASLLAGVNQATGGKLGAPPSPGPKMGAAPAAKPKPVQQMISHINGMGGYFSPQKWDGQGSFMDAYARIQQERSGGPGGQR